MCIDKSIGKCKFEKIFSYIYKKFNIFEVFGLVYCNNNQNNKFEGNILTSSSRGIIYSNNLQTKEWKFQLDLTFRQAVTAKTRM